MCFHEGGPEPTFFLTSGTSGRETRLPTAGQEGCGPLWVRDWELWHVQYNQQTNLLLILPPSQLNNMFCLIVDQEPAKKVVVFTSVISLLHAVVNPPLYGWMSQRYRRGYLFVFKMALSVCGGTRPNRRSLSKFSSPVLPLSSPDPPVLLSWRDLDTRKRLLWRQMIYLARFLN